MNNERNNETPEERARRIGVPLIPKRQPLRETPVIGNPIVGVCGECGRDVYSIDGYACMRDRCPLRGHA